MDLLPRECRICEAWALQGGDREEIEQVHVAPQTDKGLHESNGARYIRGGDLVLRIPGPFALHVLQVVPDFEAGARQQVASRECEAHELEQGRHPGQPVALLIVVQRLQ